MGQYLFSVWHDDEYEVDFSSEEARRQVAQVGQFNCAGAGPSSRRSLEGPVEVRPLQGA